MSPTPSVPVNPGPELRKLREDRGVTAAHVARRLGLSRAYLCDLELGRRAWTPERVNLYREALGLPPIS